MRRTLYFCLLLMASTHFFAAGCNPSQPTEPATESSSQDAATKDAATNDAIPDSVVDTSGSDASTPEPKKPEESGPRRCNGAVHLCGRRFDQVAYLTTHNAMSNAEEKWQIPNQNYSVTRQLDDGVRALMLDVHEHEDKPYLCHGPCILGKKLLTEGLQELQTWMAAHPHEVISIIFEMYVDAKAIAADFKASGLDLLVASQPKGATWPTLGAMLDSKRRLVVFTDKGGGTYPWYHDVWDYAWETHYSAKTTDDFTCKKNRGDKDHALFIFNHFLTNPVARPQHAEKANKNPLLQDRVDKCRKESGRFPQFITVDFYDIGDAKAVVDGLNQP